MQEFNAKKIAIVGYSGIDVAVYTALVLHRTEGDTVIADKSKEKDILNIFLPEVGGEISYASSAENYGIVVYSDEKDVPETTKYVINYFGSNCVEESIATNDIILLVTDMYAEHAKALSRVKLQIEEDIRSPLFIINNMVSSKYGRKYLTAITKQQIFKKNTEKIPFNEKDFNIRLSIGHEKFSLSGLSDDYKRLLQRIYRETTGKDFIKKQKKNVFK